MLGVCVDKDKKKFPQVRVFSGEVFELVESIHEVEAGGSWETVLVFGRYGPSPLVELWCQVRVRVRHVRGPEARTTVSVTDVTDFQGGSDRVVPYPQQIPVRAGRMQAPEKGADLLKHDRPRVRAIAEAVEDLLAGVAHRYGPWPKTEGVGRGKSNA